MRNDELVIVFWEDSCTRDAWTRQDEAVEWAQKEPYRIATAGHLFFEDESCVAVAGARTRNGAVQFDLLTRIPRGCIRHIERLGDHPWPKDAIDDSDLDYERP